MFTHSLTHSLINSLPELSVIMASSGAQRCTQDASKRDTQEPAARNPILRYSQTSNLPELEGIIRLFHSCWPSIVGQTKGMTEKEPR